MCIVAMGYCSSANLIAASTAFAQADSVHIECNASDFVRRNREAIFEAANHHAVSAVAVAGVIAAESILNRNVIDSLQDKWLSKQLEEHDQGWWEQWKDTSESAAAQAGPLRLIGNKWPTALVMSGYVMSFGPGQIQPRTAILACRRYAFSEPLCQKSTKELIAALLSEESSIRLVAVILRYEADIWLTHTKSDVKRNAALLATLYSAGAEYRIAALESKNVSELNKMGHWLAKYHAAIESLLTNVMPGDGRWCIILHNTLI
ncbi:MAG: hypothetical protein RKR03_18440 [Candidatus Competibacter sp.]|nr:hypothetical protein [Candidatus Competibacter sp.]